MKKFNNSKKNEPLRHLRHEEKGVGLKKQGYSHRDTARHSRELSVFGNQSKGSEGWIRLINRIKTELSAVHM